MLRRFAISLLLVFAFAQASSLSCAVHCAAMRRAASDGMTMSGCASTGGMGAGMDAGMDAAMGMTQDASSARFAASMPSSASTMPCAGLCSQQQEVVQEHRRILREQAGVESADLLPDHLSAHLRAQFSSAFLHRLPSPARLAIPLRI